MAEGISQGLSSGKVKLTAHFHDTGDIEFISDDTATAYQKYQTYRASHYCGESCSSRTGCFTTYHAPTTCTITESVSGPFSKYCGACAAFTDVYRVTTTHSKCGIADTTIEVCSRDWGVPSGGTSTHSYGSAYYTPSCGYTDGEIVNIELQLH